MYVFIEELVDIYDESLCFEKRFVQVVFLRFDKKLLTTHLTYICMFYTETLTLCPDMYNETICLEKKMCSRIMYLHILRVFRH